MTDVLYRGLSLDAERNHPDIPFVQKNLQICQRRETLKDSLRQGGEVVLTEGPLVEQRRHASQLRITSYYRMMVMIYEARAVQQEITAALEFTYRQSRGSLRRRVMSWLPIISLKESQRSQRSIISKTRTVSR